MKTKFKNIQGKYLIAEITKNDILSNQAKNKILEIEEKYSCGNINTLQDICLTLGFVKIKNWLEEDEYFTDINGEFIRDRTCLRARDTGGENLEVTFKGKSKILSNFYSKLEHNVLIPKNIYAQYVDIFNSLGFFKYADFNKTRICWSKNKKNFTLNIILDEIKNIGQFVEFEILSFDKECQIADLKDSLKNLIQNFSACGLQKADLPYRDYVANYIANNIINKNQLQGIIFDFDGTIIPSEKIFFECFQKIAKKIYNVDITMSDYKTYEMDMDSQLADLIRKRAKKKLAVTKAALMSKVYEQYDQLIDNIFDNENAANNFKAISMLKDSGYKIALVTASKREFVEKILNNFKASDLFNAIICREDVSRLKPNPEAYLLVLEKLGLSAKNVLAVEDSLRGIKATAAAKINCLAVYGNSIMEKEEFKKLSVFTLENIMQLALLIKYAQ